MNNYNKLSSLHKSVLEFNKWVMWSARSNCERIDTQYDFGDSYYNRYRSLRLWCVDLICENDILYSDIPDITWVNQNEAFKRCRKKIDLKKFAKLKTHEFDLKINAELITPVTRGDV